MIWGDETAGQRSVKLNKRLRFLPRRVASHLLPWACLEIWVACDKTPVKETWEWRHEEEKGEEEEGEERAWRRICEKKGNFSNVNSVLVDIQQYLLLEVKSIYVALLFKKENQWEGMKIVTKIVMKNNTKYRNNWKW